MSTQPGSPVTVGEIARRLNVSPSTVSRVLKNHPAISEATRRRTLALVKKLGYRPNKSLQRYFKAIRQESQAVAFLVSPETHSELHGSSPFYGRMEWAVQAALRAQGLHLVLANSASDLLADGNLYAVAEGMADGVIAKLTDARVVKRLAEHVPLVLFYAEVRGPSVDTVIADIEQAVRLSLDHLRALGHRRIACFRPRPPAGGGYGSWQDRRFWSEYAEYGAALGLSLPAEFFRPIVFASREHPQAMHDFLDRIESRGAMPTAILTYDVYAGELTQQLRQRGLEVPQDVSLVGFDDYTHDQFCPIPLTTFRQDFDAMAAMAVRLLQDRLRNPQCSTRVIEVAGQLIERASTAPAPAGSRAASLTARM